MKKYFPGLVVAGLALSAAIGSYHSAPPATVLDGETAAQTLQERAWVDKTSGTPKDSFNIYIFGQRNRGAFDRADSSFRHHVDLDVYKASGDTIQVRFLHDDKQASTRYTVSRLQPPVDGADLKLELTDDPMLGGSHVYYSRSNDRRDVESRLDAMEGFDSP